MNDVWQPYGEQTRAQRAWCQTCLTCVYNPSFETGLTAAIVKPQM